MTAASLTFVGTATTVLRLGGFTLLNLTRRGQRVHLGYGLASRRRTDPAPAPDQFECFRDVDVVVTHLGGTRVSGVLVTRDDRQASTSSSGSGRAPWSRSATTTAASSPVRCRLSSPRCAAAVTVRA